MKEQTCDDDCKDDECFEHFDDFFLFLLVVRELGT